MTPITFSTIFFPFLVAFIGTVIATPICIYVLKRIKLVDDPKSHKHPAILHTVPIPRGGGIPFLFGILLSGALFLGFTPITISLGLASLIALIIGIADDKFDVSPYVRFLGNFFVALIVVSSGISIQFITNPFGGILYLDSYALTLPFFGYSLIINLSQVITILWIMWVMNMLNWSKGVDGQMPGIVAISAITIGLVSLRFSGLDANSLLSAELSFMIAGSAIGFLLFNFYPAKIFPGYGATAVYLLLAVVSILSSAKLATAILVMGIPMVDGIFTVIRRIASGKSPFWHDKKHLHHLLLQMGFGQRHIALFYWSISAILGGIALLLSSTGKLFAIIMLVVIVGMILLFLHFALSKSNGKNSL